jgi:hypothetical protein
MYRAGYYATREELRRRVTEPPPARVQVLTGPRQVGKTTLMLQLAKEWGDRAIYVAADAPEAALPGWWEAQWERATRLARAETALLLIDEIHYLPSWSRLLKAETDRMRRQHLALHVVVSGSTALRVGKGVRETMAGRFERLVLSHWSARDLAQGFHLSKEEAVDCVVRLGGFPGGMSLRRDPRRWRAYIVDSIIEPAIGRDLLVLEAIRRPALLRQVFAICVGHAAEIVSLQKMAGLLAERGALATIAHYLQLLQEAYLVAPLAKFSGRELRQRASPPKLVALNNAFLTATALGDAAAVASDPGQRGRLIENACIAFAINSGQTAHYWRAEPVEVDAVLDGAWGRWAVEIKTGSYSARDLAGLLEFVRRFRSYRPLVICEEADLAVARRAGVFAVPWTEFLWSGVEAASGGLA